jgi:hypothetical protein
MFEYDYDDEDDDVEESDDSDDSGDEDSSSSTTEVSEQSWGERLKSAIGGVLFGIVLFLASFVILWKNEGNLVDEYKKYGLIQKETVKADATKVEPNNNEKLVHLQGKVEVTQPAEDDLFKFTLANAVRIDRTVEMYQWKESSSSKSETKVGGKKVTKTTYSYKEEWSSTYNNSSNFKKPKGHRNPPMNYKSGNFTAKAAKLGAFSLSSSLISQISKSEDVNIEVAKFTATLPADLKDKLHKSGNQTEKTIYFGDPNKPKTGDYRLSYKVVKPGDATIIAKQSGNALTAYNIKSVGKSVEILRDGTLSVDDIVMSGEKGAKTFAWILRLVGFVCMAVGIYLIFNPLVVLADVLPFLGSLLGFGIGLFAGIIAFALSLVTIAIAWLAARPMVSIPLLVIGIGGLVAYKILGAKKKEA